MVPVDIRGMTDHVGRALLVVKRKEGKQMSGMNYVKGCGVKWAASQSHYLSSPGGTVGRSA